MADAEIDRRFALALELAERAAALALEHWRGRAALAIETKANSQDMVSEADRAVERSIHDAVAAAFPGDGFLGEEYGLAPGTSGFTWVVDPIDGTSPFLHGIPNWCVAVAVARGSEPVVGVTVAPAIGEAFAACMGRGATLNGRPLAIPPGVTIRNAATGLGSNLKNDPDALGGCIAGLMRRGGMYFCNGSGALMLAYVAAGRLAGFLTGHMHAWDCLAGLVLIREAGGRAAPFGSAGDLVGPDRVLAAAPGAWDELASLMRNWPRPVALTHD